MNHDLTARKPSKWQLIPFRIATIYATVGALWILFSDTLLGVLVKDPTTLTRLQTLKGWFYVLVTAWMLYMLVNRSIEAIRRSEETLRTTIESMTDAVLVIDPEGNVADVNRAGLELLGLTAKHEAIGALSEFYRRFQPRYLDGRPIPLAEDCIVRALLGEATRGCEGILRRADGREIYVSISASQVRDRGERNVVTAVAVLRDMTELKRLERLRDEFLATAAHELRTPITVIRGYSQLMLTKETVEDKRRSLQIIDRQADRIRELVDEMLRVSEIKAGRVELHKERVDLTALVREVAGRMQMTTEKHRLPFRGDVEAMVDADPSQTEVVLTNLVDNAIRYSPKGGDVEITVSTTDTDAVVSVKDYGLGIPAEKQKHVFEPFFQIQPAIAGFGGMGLGLFISKVIVEQQGGRIWFESIEGKGSTFYFSLPLAPGIH